ncbi:MAG: TlpA family protein disulfide reductase [Cyclobacteriaceae bacterium]
MKKYLINSLIVLLMFILYVFLNTFLSIFYGVVLEDRLGFPTGSDILPIFLLTFLLCYLYLLLFHKRISSKGVLISFCIIVLAWIVLTSMGTTIKYPIKKIPEYLTLILGTLAGYLYFERKKFKTLLLLAVFPMIMCLGPNDLWRHRIEYGNWTGEVSEQKIIPFEFTNKEGELVNNQTLNGKIVLFDFWFISCGPCWSQFPETQRVYEKYQSNPNVELYAVNRPIRGDKPGALFSRIEEKNYTFPVLKGTQEMMDTLGVYKYPTIMVLNKNGEISFMGELDKAEEKIEILLNNTSK